jgi:hypothetical protein
MEGNAMSTITYEELVEDKEDERFVRLEGWIKEHFGHLAQDEIDLLGHSFERVKTMMFEILSLRRRGSSILDLDLDIELRPVVFPEELQLLLRSHDAFLGTIGFRKGRWEVLYLSQPYHSVEYDPATIDAE